MDLKPATELLLGNLELTYPEGTKIPYLASSGCVQWQQPEDQSAIARGPIPAGQYSIPTIPYWVETRGIEGWFFHITPDPVVVNGVTRGEFGIHFDANVPGSAGCIVLQRSSGWKRFCERMQLIAKCGVESLPLEVRY